MNLVIQCAASKQAHAGTLKQEAGTPVRFVAKPHEMAGNPEWAYAHPDDVSDAGMSWREQLLKYNRTPGSNPLGLLPAWKLYRNPIYGKLVQTYGPGWVYILSAGWGLISAEFLTPDYNITFSPSGGKGSKRGLSSRYDDLCLVPQESKEPIVFFGGKSYLPLFCNLTNIFKGRKVVFYNSDSLPSAPGCKLKRFKTRVRTNWQYQCASDFIDGKISI